MDQRIKDLNLLLLVLSGWEEESRSAPGEKVYRSWKGYLFEALNELEEDRLIQQFKSTKSVVVTKEGLRRASEIKEKFLGQAKSNESSEVKPKGREVQGHERW